ncbi:flagellar biosynthesis repressor FlbT [Solirhodobacter olei]|uniref:flagellar biosynthesis repressor FlbT n=1 Tax=Solirhodobacter olei TaxID=2493082 RepID=UPI000FD8082F|nr:flagellar biosynthesis repressor FlbT [Solirhodobacter olei]
MGLKLTLKPNERVVVNGCVIRNSNKRHVLTIENRADVVRGEDLLLEASVATPVKQAYFLIQTALISPETREKLMPVINDMLVKIIGVFSRERTGCVFDAANFVATQDYYKAMAALRPLMRYEQTVLDYAAGNGAPPANGPGVAAEATAPEPAEAATGER